MSQDFYQELEEMEQPAKETILMREDELIHGLLTAAKFKEDDSLQRKVQIRRKGALLFEFYIRPLTEEEIQDCRKRVTKRRPDPRGRQFGTVEGDTDFVKLRSNKILLATVDRGNGVIWSNKKLKDSLGVLTDVDVIDAVLMGGEKDRICDIIDEISGYGMDQAAMEEEAKN